MHKPKRQRSWPTQAEWTRRDTIERLDVGIARLAQARQAIERMKTDLALAHVEFSRGVMLEAVRDLERAKDGEPDDLAVALRLLARALDGADVHEEGRRLIAQYEGGEG